MDNHLDVRAKPTNFLQQLSSVALVSPIQAVCLLCRLLTGTKSPDESDKTFAIIISTAIISGLRGRNDDGEKVDCKEGYSY